MTEEKLVCDISKPEERKHRDSAVLEEIRDRLRDIWAENPDRFCRDSRNWDDVITVKLTARQARCAEDEIGVYLYATDRFII